MKSRWLRTVSCSYAAAEDGTWRGRWIGRAWDPQGRLRGLSFASRRRGRVWAFWIGRDRRVEAPPWRERLGAATLPMDFERCGWRVQRAAHVFKGQPGYEDAPDRIRVSKDGFSCFMPLGLYEDLDDEAFVAICEAKRKALGTPS